jgi:hypothetical protein
MAKLLIWGRRGGEMSWSTDATQCVPRLHIVHARRWRTSVLRAHSVVAVWGVGLALPARGEVGVCAVHCGTAAWVWSRPLSHDLWSERRLLQCGLFDFVLARGDRAGSMAEQVYGFQYGAT